MCVEHINCKLLPKITLTTASINVLNILPFFIVMTTLLKAQQRDIARLTGVVESLVARLDGNHNKIIIC